jgi:uncharacterized protein (DUF952 family)
MIYFLLTRQEWDDGRYTHLLVEPGEEGFVHCCDERQIEMVRRTYFPPNKEVLAVGLDPTQLDVETRYEPGSGGEPERFPHVYGPLLRRSVELVRPA